MRYPHPYKKRHDFKLISLQVNWHPSPNMGLWGYMVWGSWLPQFLRKNRSSRSAKSAWNHSWPWVKESRLSLEIGGLIRISSTISTESYMRKSIPKDWQVSFVEVLQGFSHFFLVVSSDYGKPWHINQMHLEWCHLFFARKGRTFTFGAPKSEADVGEERQCCGDLQESMYRRILWCQWIPCNIIVPQISP